MNNEMQTSFWKRNTCDNIHLFQLYKTAIFLGHAKFALPAAA